MSAKRIFLMSTLGLFVFITFLGMNKKNKQRNKVSVAKSSIQEVAFDAQNQPLEVNEELVHAPIVSKEKAVVTTPLSGDQLPSANYIESFFDPAALKLPIVETITYSSRVSWLKGKPAWVSDYASHFKTSKHFIARSLNRKADYFSQNVKHGDRFNVLRTDKEFYFYLLIDISRCKMWFYYVDKETDERVLVKTYNVGLGRPDTMKASGFLTPLGRYALGDKIAVYKPGVMGHYGNQPTEMVKVFGTRWIPFEKELDQCSAPAKGFGLHGNPLSFNEQTGQWEEDKSGISDYASDGCLRLPKEDMEELFAIIVSRYTEVELVKDYHDAKLPGHEKKMN